MNFSERFRFILLVSGLFVFSSLAAPPSFADLAVLLSKGYFKSHVPADASVEQCVAFLNSHGVCFSLFDIMDPTKVVTKEDCARVVGQSTLLFLGEAEVVSGCVVRPDGIETWLDYCLLNDVDIDSLWEGFLRRLEKKPLPEVQSFYGHGAITGDMK